MTDIEQIELALRRVMASAKNEYVADWFHALADELAKMKPVNYHEPEYVKDDRWPSGYKLKWVP